VTISALAAALAAAMVAAPNHVGHGAHAKAHQAETTATFTAAQRQAAIWGSVQARIDQQNDIWFDDGDFPRDVQSLRFEFALYPSDYDIATNLGWMQENIEEWDDALTTYQEFHRLNPNDPDSTFPEALYFFLKKKYALVPPLLNPVIENRPQPNAFRILASAYEHLKQYKDSIRVWNLYMKDQDAGFYPKDPESKHNLDRVTKKLASGG